jgi:hypothetical protein
MLEAGRTGPPEEENMIVSLVVAVPGIILLLVLVASGIVAGPGRRSRQALVAPRGARYSDATRILRAAADERA